MIAPAGLFTVKIACAKLDNEPAFNHSRAKLPLGGFAVIQPVIVTPSGTDVSVDMSGVIPAITVPTQSIKNVFAEDNAGIHTFIERNRAAEWMVDTEVAVLPTTPIAPNTPPKPTAVKLHVELTRNRNT